MNTIELLPITTTKIADHEQALLTCEPLSNAHAYHLGQTLKWQKIRRMLKGLAESKTRFLNLKKNF